jgi:hypothetical protein
MAPVGGAAGIQQQTDSSNRMLISSVGMTRLQSQKVYSN